MPKYEARVILQVYLTIEAETEDKALSVAEALCCDGDDFLTKEIVDEWESIDAMITSEVVPE